MEEVKVKAPGSDVGPAQSQLWLIDEEGQMFISTDAIDLSLIVNIKVSECFPAASLRTLHDSETLQSQRV